MRERLIKFLLYAAAAINLALIGIIWWQGSGGMFAFGLSSSLISLGRLAGLILELSIALQFLLIGRVGFIESLFGHDKLNKIHRWVGYTAAVFLIIHPLLLIIGYGSQHGQGLWAQFLDFVLNWEDVLKGLIGALLLVAIIGISVAIVRKRMRYETWYFIHLLTYLVFILAIGHQVNFGDFGGRGGVIAYWYALNFGTLGLLLLYRFIRPLWNFSKHRFTLSGINAENPNTTSLYITGKNLGNFKFKPGQFANLTFLKNRMWFTPPLSPNSALAKNKLGKMSYAVYAFFTELKGAGFTHPFSFSAAPNGNSIRFTIKASGDFTNKIRSLPIGARVILDGPLGRFTEIAAKTDKFLLLAGGIGITPIRSLIESLASQEKDVVLLYAAKNPADLVFKDELESLHDRLHFFLTEITEEPAAGFEQGRIDEEKIKRLVPDFKDRSVYVCGPVPMIDATRKLLARLGVPKKRIHYEKFAY